MNLKNKQCETLMVYMENLDVEIMNILKKRGFLDNLVKKNVEFFSSSIFLEYVFFDDLEEMYGSRENDISSCLYITNTDRGDFYHYDLVSEFKDFYSEEDEQYKGFIQDLEKYKKHSIKAVELYIDEYNENRFDEYQKEHLFIDFLKIKSQHRYFIEFINNIDNNVMCSNNIRTHLYRKILDYGVTYNNGKELIYYATYIFFEDAKLDKDYDGYDSVYKALHLIEDDYDVNSTTYSFQIKINSEEGKIYYRIIPSEDKSFKFLSKTVGTKELEVLKKESEYFISLVKSMISLEKEKRV